MGHAQQKAAELRCEPRLALTSRELPGRLEIETTNQQLFAAAVDVSRGGLGIVCGESIPKGTILTFTDEEGGSARLQVMWTTPTEDGRFHRYGLRVVDPDYDMAAVFFTYGRADFEFDASDVSF